MAVGDRSDQLAVRGTAGPSGTSGLGDEGPQRHCVTGT